MVGEEGGEVAGVDPQVAGVDPAGVVEGRGVVVEGVGGGWRGRRTWDGAMGVDGGGRWGDGRGVRGELRVRCVVVGVMVEVGVWRCRASWVSAGG